MKKASKRNVIEPVALMCKSEEMKAVRGLVNKCVNGIRRPPPGR
jgi:hypothetical protein